MNEIKIHNFGITDIKNSRNTKEYEIWSSMIQRCYSKNYQNTHPTYKNNSVSLEWEKLSDFKRWYNINYIEGYQLDKDIFIPNNKVYSPTSCIFIPQNINLLIARGKSKGYRKRINRYQALIWDNVIKKNISLGNYDTQEEAHYTYLLYKANVYMNVADEWKDINIKIFYGLYRHAELLLGYDWKKTLPELN